jgi:glucose-6-phosphate dehydrogenase assembly protein OpcA
MHTTTGPIELTRPDGRTARLSRPGVASHDVPLPRRDLRDLIGEELRRLDPDDTYAEALDNVEVPSSRRRRATTKKAAPAEPARPRKAPAKKAPARRASAKKTQAAQ